MLFNIISERRKMIDKAPANQLPSIFAVNELAKALHPGYIPAIAAIREETENVKTFTLVPASSNKVFRISVRANISL